MAMVGLLVQIMLWTMPGNVISYDQVSVRAFFAFCLIVSSTVFLEIWKRNQDLLQYKWFIDPKSNCEGRTRPEYEADQVIDNISGELIKDHIPNKKWKFLSSIILSALISTVVTLIILIMIFKQTLTNRVP